MCNKNVETIRLFEEYRLVERRETEVNGAWKGLYVTDAGVHLLLFFMAFVFGSFCTFCFHMLMYLFDEKCVLYPKLQSLTALKHNVIYEFIPSDKEAAETLPLDFLSTQWVDKSACYLPTYVPLISGIFGLVWTTMFLMCSTGSRTLTGLQRPWRVLPPVFLFSLAMGGLCIYSSAVTHFGLQELCLKLGEITGSPTCTYTVNVATLAYERRIRGVYQATRLTIFSAWLHTSCWLLSALLTLIRVLMVVDFQLVRINVDLIGDIDKLLENHEQQLCTVLPEVWFNTDNDSMQSFAIHSRVVPDTEFANKILDTEDDVDDVEDRFVDYVPSDMLFFSRSSVSNIKSEHSLVPEERHKLQKAKAYASVDFKHQFIVKILFDLLESIELLKYASPLSPSMSKESVLSVEGIKGTEIVRQYGQERITSLSKCSQFSGSAKQIDLSISEAQVLAQEIRHNLEDQLTRKIVSLPSEANSSIAIPSTSKAYTEKENVHFETNLNIIEETEKPVAQNINLDQKNSPSTSKMIKKSNLKNVAIQTDVPKRKLKGQKVHIADLITKNVSSDESDETAKDKEAQTPQKKKQD